MAFYDSSIMRKKRQKVVIAMSGGVDSSVAAALLKRAGFDVIGVFMRFWSEGKKAENRCCSTDSERRARQVAKILKIPFYVFNFEKEFKKRIVDYFIKGYKEGITPNPCVVCNKEIKFGLLLEKAMTLNADFIATGHYARKIQNAKIKSQNDNSKLKNFRLLKGNDENKDQSYFLWQLEQKQLAKILFPVGNYTKPEVRKLAEKFKLPFKKIPESMEICFVADANVGEFLKKRIKASKGKIVDVKRKIIGEHQGLFLYTIGQRKGIGLSGGPYWVVGKNLKNNRL
ncbi:MAG: tRNA 2-thiouridine(34) synthase MnmA, partial [bacterium]|nr:tRNA 2-thiouridine(34) synthase MnmA [bacterium]